MHTEGTDLKRIQCVSRRGSAVQGYLIVQRGVRHLRATGFFKNADLDFDGNFRAADCSGILELCYTA